MAPDTHQNPAQPEWNRIDYSEYPPEEEMVWTTDGSAVRQGKWSFAGPHAPLEEGKWEDEHGSPIAVTHWLFLEESPNGPPVPPPPQRRAHGGIVGFLESDPE